MKLSVKRRKFVDAKLSGKGHRDSAIVAGYAPKGAHVRGSELMRHPDVQEAIRSALDKQGIDDARIARELDKGLRKGELGPHDSYLKLATELRGLKKPAPVFGAQINIQLLQGIYRQAVDVGIA